MVSKRTIFQVMAKSSRWFGAVGAGYLVVVAFLVGYILAAELKPDIGTTAHVTCGILSAAPIAVAFIWERLRSVKVLGVEIALSEYSAGLLPLGENRLVDAVASKQYFSDSPEILRKVREAVLVPGRQILEINLRSEP